ncbi:MAG: hypothetical protein AAF658_18380, partial [Myxococcota bacterium]
MGGLLACSGPAASGAIEANLYPVRPKPDWAERGIFLARSGQGVATYAVATHTGQSVYCNGAGIRQKLSRRARAELAKAIAVDQDRTRGSLTTRSNATMSGVLTEVSGWVGPGGRTLKALYKMRLPSGGVEAGGEPLPEPSSEPSLFLALEEWQRNCVELQRAEIAADIANEYPAMWRRRSVFIGDSPQGRALYATLQLKRATSCEDDVHQVALAEAHEKLPRLGLDLAQDTTGRFLLRRGSGSAYNRDRLFVGAYADPKERTLFALFIIEAKDNEFPGAEPFE